MTLIPLTVLWAVFAAPPAAADAKPVRLAWFPRFSPDGTLVLAAHGGWDKKEGGEARLWAAADGAAVHAFRHPRGVRSVAWSPRGTLFVTGGYGQGVRGFDVKGRNELFHLADGETAENVRVTADDKLLVASFGIGDVRLYDLAGRRVVHTFEAAHDGGVWGMALSADGSLLATAGKDTFVNVFDLGSRRKVHALKHPAEVNGVAFSPDGRSLATGCLDSRVRVFDTATGERAAMFRASDRGTVTDIQFAPDGKSVATSAFDGTVRLWDVSDLKNPVQKLTLRAHAGAAFGVAVSPDGRRLASAGWDGEVKVWDVGTGEVVWGWKRD